MIRVVSTGRLAWRYATGIMGLKLNDVWLASYPRAGSTWVRFILCNLISLSELDRRPVDFHFVGATMPSLGRSKLLKPWPYRIVPRFVKTHQSYRPFLFVRPRRAVYILRDPRDIMVSYYYFQQDHVRRPFRGSFAEFIRDARYGLLACLQHYRSWFPHAQFVLRYEALKLNAVAELQEMFTKLQVPVSDELLRLAVENSSFKKMRAMETEGGISDSNRFARSFKTVRKGKSRQWSDFFSDEDLAFYEQVCQEYGFDVYS